MRVAAQWRALPDPERDGDTTLSNGTKRLLALTLAAGMMTACESATGPAEPDSFNAEAALADYEALDAIMTSESWRGFQAMGRTVGSGTFRQGAAVIIRSAAELSVFRGGNDARTFARLLAGAGEEVLRAAAGPIISNPHRGKTFVYDAELDRYVIDPDRQDAPTTGVRFVIYAEKSGRPDPSQEIGYADLIDEGDNSVEDIVLHLIVVNGEDPVLDYRTTLDERNGAGAITVDGYIQGDSDRLAFRIDVQGTAGSFDVAFLMDVANRSFRIEGSVSGTKQGESETGDIDVLVRHGNESLRVDASGTEASISGTVYLHDKPFVDVSGDPAAPTFTRPDGQPIGRVEMLVLHQVFDIVEDVFDLFEDLMDPIDELVTLAVIL